jgi:hypothetical protein
MRKRGQVNFSIDPAERAANQRLAKELGLRNSRELYLAGVEAMKDRKREEEKRNAKARAELASERARREVRGLEGDGPNDHRQAQLKEQTAGRRAEAAPAPVWTDSDRRASGGAFRYYSPRPRPQSYGSRKAQGFLNMGYRPPSPDVESLKPPNYKPLTRWRP